MIFKTKLFYFVNWKGFCYDIMTCNYFIECRGLAIIILQVCLDIMLSSNELVLIKIFSYPLWVGLPRCYQTVSVTNSLCIHKILIHSNYSGTALSYLNMEFGRYEFQIWKILNKNICNWILIVRPQMIKNSVILVDIISH